MSKRDRHVTVRSKADAKAAEQPRRMRTFFFIAFCGLLLVSGFFLAGRQHFSSMDYGMRNSTLRRQVDQLEAEKRRLQLARETQLSPAELKKAAKKAGVVDVVPVSAVTLPAPTKEIAGAQQAAEEKPLVIKTAAVSAAKPVAEKAEVRTNQPERQRKVTTAAE